MLEKGVALQLSRELKIDLFTIYREYLQILFLKYFYGQKESQKIYLKGGTAYMVPFVFLKTLISPALLKQKG